MKRELDALRFGPADRANVFLGFVHPGKIHTTFAMSVLRLLMALKHRVTVVPCYSGPNVSGPRNQLIEAFLHTDCQHLLMVDTDIEFTPDDVDALLAHDLPIVGGAYMNKYPGVDVPIPVASVALPDGDYGRATRENLGAESGLVQVAGLGMGFTLVKREVLENMGAGVLWPFAEIAVTGESLGATGPAAELVHFLSEDICFCFRAATKGWDSWLDLDVRLGHHKTTVYRR